MLPGERARHEVGGYIRVGLKEQVTENVTYAVRLDLFSNYLEELKPSTFSQTTS